MKSAATERQVLRLVESVLDVPPDKRAAWIAENAGSRATGERVTALLALEEDADVAFKDIDARRLLAADEPDIGDVVGSYQLLEKIGEGGMATVYLAERVDGAFDQRVALKILRSGLKDDNSLALFHHERQVLANLQHAAIAGLYDGGNWKGEQPYVAMEYVDGIAIDEFARSASLAQIIELLIQVCDGVQTAHDALVIHRDLKPGNILVTADGQPKVLDFGIAKTLSNTARDVTYSAEMTPRYASPEQLRGERLTTRTDVYSLGVLLYELLVTELPYGDGDLTPVQLEKRITSAAASLPSVHCATLGDIAMSRRLEGDLDAIAMKAIDEDATRRYRNAGELGADLQRFADGYPVHATPHSGAYVLGKLVRRNKLPFVLGGLAAISLIGGVVASTWQYRLASAERDNAQQVNTLLQDVILSPSQWSAAQGNALSMPGDVKVLDLWNAVEEAIIDRDVSANIKVEVLANLAQSHLNVDAWDDTIRVAELAVQIAADSGVQNNEHLLRAMQSRTYAMHKGQHAQTREAYETLLRAQANSAFAGTAEHGELLRNYGIWLWGAGDLESAAAQIDASVEILDTLQHSAGTAYSLGNGGLLDCQRGHIASCVQKLDGAIAAWQDSGQPPIPSFHRAKATALLYMGEVPAAIAEARKAKRAGEELVPNTLEHLRAAVELARTLIAAGNIDEAAAVAREATSIEDQLLKPGHPERVPLLLAMSRIESARGNGPAALNNLEQIEGLRSNTTYDVSRSELDFSWGLALTAVNDRESASEYFQRAYDFRREFFGEDAHMTQVVRQYLQPNER